MKIIFRDIVESARNYYDKDEVLLFIGARQAGKTTILRIIQEELEKKGEKTFFLNLEDPDYLRLINQSPKNLLRIFTFDPKVKTTVFVDEVQYLNNPANFLKYFYDEYKGNIRLIVSGSSAFYLDRKFKDSLAGRKFVFPVRTLSFREFLRFKGEDALMSLLPAKFDHSNYLLGKKISLSDKERIQNLFFEFLLFGGYPRVVLAPLSEKKIILQDVVYSYIRKDIYDADIKQDEIFYRLFKVLAAQVGNLVNNSELSNLLGVSHKAIQNYLYVMQKSFHILLIRPWYRNIRKELSKMPKVYFYDLGLRNFLVNNFDPVPVRSDRGILLENAAVRQLVERAGILPEDMIKFWRYKTGAEIDIIFDDKIAFEVKFDANLFRKNKSRTFFEHYPEIKFNLVAMEQYKKLEFPVWEPWLL
ncbi:MAG: ATP-binding protein [candidate division WOR-3 bacterium]